MRKYLPIIILAISSCHSVREIEHRTTITVDTIVAYEKVKVVDSIYKVADTIYHKTHEVVDRYIYKTNTNSDTIYVQQQAMTKTERNNNTPWYIAMVAVSITILMLIYGIYRKK